MKEKKKKKRFSLQRVDFHSKEFWLKVSSQKTECEIHTENSPVHTTYGVSEDGDLHKSSGLVSMVE